MIRGGLNTHVRLSLPRADTSILTSEEFRARAVTLELVLNANDAAVIIQVCNHSLETKVSLSPLPPLLSCTSRPGFVMTRPRTQMLWTIFPSYLSSGNWYITLVVSMSSKIIRSQKFMLISSVTRT